MGTGQQKERVFEVVAEYLNEAIESLAAETASTEEVLAWLPGMSTEVAICTAQTGALRLAALLDVQCLQNVLNEQFLPGLLSARPAEASALKTIVARTGTTLSSWVLGRTC